MGFYVRLREGRVVNEILEVFFIILTHLHIFPFFLFSFFLFFSILFLILKLNPFHFTLPHSIALRSFEKHIKLETSFDALVSLLFLFVAGTYSFSGRPSSSYIILFS